MRAISAPFMLACHAHHSRSVRGSMATATYVYFQPICTSYDTAAPRGTQLRHTRPRSPTRRSLPYTMPCPAVRPASASRSASPAFFQVSRAWVAAFGWRGWGVFSQIPSRGSSVYRLPTA